jgi:hypothetical protein
MNSNQSLLIATIADKISEITGGDGVVHSIRMRCPKKPAMHDGVKTIVQEGAVAYYSVNKGGFCVHFVAAHLPVDEEKTDSGHPMRRAKFFCGQYGLSVSEAEDLVVDRYYKSSGGEWPVRENLVAEDC